VLVHSGKSNESNQWVVGWYYVLVHREMKAEGMWKINDLLFLNPVYSGDPPLPTKMAEVNEGLRLTADIPSWNRLSF